MRMLKGNRIEQINDELLEAIPVITSFIKELTEFKEQSVIITEDITANFLSYQTGNEHDRVWEAHKLHYDLHYMFEGKESIAFSSKQSEMGDYYLEEDYYLLQGLSEYSEKLLTGQWLFIDIEEAHRTGIGNGEQVKKIVFKIRKA